MSERSVSPQHPQQAAGDGSRVTARRRLRTTKQPSVDLRAVGSDDEWPPGGKAGRAASSSNLGAARDNGAPRFSGYLQIRSSGYVSTWRKRWFTLDGHYLQCFRSRESQAAQRTFYIANCEIRERADKMEFRLRINNKRSYYELRSNDRADYQAWQLVLQRAREWKDPAADGFVVIHQNDGRGIARTSSFDSLSEVFEEVGSETDSVRQAEQADSASEFALMTPEELENARKNFRARLMVELKTLQERYSKLEARSPEADSFMKTSKALLKAFTDFLNHLEGERDFWENKFRKEAQRSFDLETTIRMLAKEHHQLEKAATKSTSAEAAETVRMQRPSRSGPSRDFNSLDDDSSDDSDSEYFDAVERAAGLDSHDTSSASVGGGSSHMARTSSAGMGKAAAETPASGSASAPSSPKHPQQQQQQQQTHAQAQAQAQAQPQSGAMTTTAKGGAAGPLTVARRDRLPTDRTAKRLSLWSLLKNNIGKDLSKIALPIVINEPLSALQRCVEDMEYSHLLDKAADAETSVLRLAYLACFAISNYSTTMTRVNKPFNPILGETYELIRPERGDGFRCFSEQVSHHPPISVMNSESLARKWEWWQTVLLGSSFRGKDMEIYPLGITHIFMPQRNNEHYTFRKVTCCVRNIIVGRSWVDNYGQATVTIHTTGDVAELTFHPYSFFSGSVADVDGVVKDRDGQVHYRLKGKWTENVRLAAADEDPAQGQIIWQRQPLPPWASRQFDFTYFTMSMNEVEADHVKYMPRTDCRFRPDQQLYENGRVDEAQVEKDRLEDKQRAARRLLEARGERYKPRFFELKYDAQLGRENWVSNGTYWKRREQRAWDDLPDLFGQQ